MIMTHLQITKCNPITLLFFVIWHASQRSHPNCDKIPIQMNAAVGSTDQVILIGDGDFSFTLALTNYLPPSCIVGTNLETDESIQKHRNAQDNMKELIEKGVRLILGVDARHLHTHPQVGQQRFRRIIFNFPHIGGKSNNKKNRALLDDFFRSAAGVLTTEGEVMVTLCQGQGGTPADQPQRLWADSWQIVSMAANSGFILTQLVPFEAEIYPGYSCTGFRSQDKGFHTKGSLTHIFQRRDAIPVPQNVTPLPVILDRKEFLCPTYLHSKISSYRKIMENPLQPFKQTQDALISEMAMFKITKSISEDQLPCVMQQSDLSVSSPELWACQLTVRESLGEEKERLSTSDYRKSTNVSLNGFKSPADVLESPDNRSVFKDGMESYFRTSLIENVPFLLDSEDLEKHQLVLTSGLTFRQGVISPCSLPVSIELLGLTKCKMEENELLLEEIYEMLSRSLKTSCSISTKIVPSTKETPSPIQIKTISIEFFKKFMCKNIAEKSCIGYILKISNQNDDGTQFWGFLISIDNLTQIRFSVDHESLLWQENFGKFLKPDPQLSSATVNKYEPVSIFPLKFVHDMSFWENAASAFDESKLSRIVRDVAGDCVSSVTLIDTYQEPETKRKGRCYRLTFQSWDLCLSYETSWKLQSLIRLVTAEKMGITLR